MTKEQFINNFREYLLSIISYGTEIARGYPNHISKIEYKIADIFNEVNENLLKIDELKSEDEKIAFISATIKNMANPNSSFYSILPLLDSIWYEESSKPDFLYSPLSGISYDTQKFELMISPLKDRPRETVTLDLPSIFKKGRVPLRVKDYFDKILAVHNLKVVIIQIYKIEDPQFDFCNLLKKSDSQPLQNNDKDLAQLYEKLKTEKEEKENEFKSQIESLKKNRSKSHKRKRAN